MILSELEAVIASKAESGSLPQLISDTLSLHSHITPLDTSATRHKMYLLEDMGVQYIVRTEPELDSLPGVEPDRERRILDAINAFDWSPNVLINEPQQGLLIMQHAGHCSDILNASQKALIVRAVVEMQGVTDVPSMDYPHLFNHYRHALTDQGHQQLIDETEHLLMSLPILPSVLVHHDLHPGNICWQNGAPTIIDWEYAGLGNAWLDFAVLTRDLGFTDQELVQFPLLQGFETGELAHWVAESIQVIEQLETLWLHYKTQFSG